MSCIPEGYKIVHRAGEEPVLEKLTDADRARSDRYADYMAEAESNWSHAVSALNETTLLSWSVWQTGGGCLAIGATFEDDADLAGRHVMLTDATGPLGLNRERGEHGSYENLSDEERRWMLGFYHGGDNDDGTADPEPLVLDWFDVTEVEDDGAMAYVVELLIRKHKWTEVEA